MIDDLPKTIKAQLYERINSPLLGSFLLSWATWNYKFIVVLFSAMSVEKTFAYIDQTLYPTFWDKVLMYGIYPLATSALLIYAYPYPAKWVYEFSRNRQKELKEIQQKIDDETPLTKEEARAIRGAASKQSFEFEEQTQKSNATITRLQTEQEHLLKQINQENLKPKEVASVLYPPALSPTQIEILKLITSNTNGVIEDSLHSLIKTDTLTRDYDIGELLAKGLIRTRMTEGDETLFYADHEGRKALLKATKALA
jgi:hypothetical protein